MFVRVLARTFAIAAGVTVLCLLLGYPLAINPPESMKLSCTYMSGSRCLAASTVICRRCSTVSGSGKTA
jgi:hypothetical protein